MLLLRKAHLGEVSVTVWPKILKEMCERKKIFVLDKRFLDAVYPPEFRLAGFFVAEAALRDRHESLNGPTSIRLVLLMPAAQFTMAAKSWSAGILRRVSSAARTIPLLRMTMGKV